jgi:hypothetical protein
MPQHSANIAPTWSQNETRDFQNRAQIEPGGAKKDDDNDNDADDDADDDDNDAADDDDDDCDDDDDVSRGLRMARVSLSYFRMLIVLRVLQMMLLTMILCHTCSVWASA